MLSDRSTLFTDTPIGSRVAIGTWGLGGNSYGTCDPLTAIKTLYKAIELGINIIDTSNIYGFGQAEKYIAEVTKHNRKELIISTKFGMHWDKFGHIHNDNSPAKIRESIFRSMDRMATDYIDVVNIHWPDGKTPLKSIVEVLHEFKSQGLVRHIGCSNFSISEINPFLIDGLIETVQLPCNFLDRSILRQHRSSAPSSIPIFIFDVLARGLLTGKYNIESRFPDNDTRKKMKDQRSEEFIRKVHAGRLIKAACDAAKFDPIHFLTTWALSCDQHTIVMMNFMNENQINHLNVGINSDTTSELIAKLETQLTDYILF